LAPLFFKQASESFFFPASDSQDFPFVGHQSQFIKKLLNLLNQFVTTQKQESKKI